jgi:hypothetical protein
MRWLPAAALLMLGLVACGGTKPPQDVAREYVATNAPRKCDALTQSLVERLTQRRGEAARAACRRNVARFAAPRDVKVRQTHAEGRVAEVQLIADGRPAEIRLVKQGGRWRISGLGE